RQRRRRAGALRGALARRRLAGFRRRCEYFVPSADVPVADHAVENKRIASDELFGSLTRAEYGHGPFFLRVGERADHQESATGVELLVPRAMGGEVEPRSGNDVRRGLVKDDVLHNRPPVTDARRGLALAGVRTWGSRVRG